MLTTVLNPTLWVLLAVLVSATWALVRGGTAQCAFTLVVRRATAPPVLLLLAAAALVTVGSRVVIGYSFPGAYAEEVVAAREFLAAREGLTTDARGELQRWFAEEPAPVDPWALPGVSTCSASALADRPQFYSSHAHSPVLLLASVPIVQVAGGRGLYVFIVTLSFLATATLVWRFAALARLAPWSREFLLLACVVSTWQPVLAAVRQGDAVLIAAALAVSGRALCTRGLPALGGIAVGGATALWVPSALLVLPLVRQPRALATAGVTVVGAVAATVAAGGPLLLVDFAANAQSTAVTYGQAVMNYALFARLAAHGTAVPSLIVLGVGWTAWAFWFAWPTDRAFAAFSVIAVAAAPVAWSQHLVFTAIPLAVLLRHVLQSGRPGGLVSWCLVALLLSLPDQAVARASDLLAGAAAAWPLAPSSLLVLGAWTLTPARALRTAPRAASSTTS